MGIETATEYGGAGGSFTSAIIAIEELAKIDPSVSVLCDVHNTLVNTVIRKYGTEDQQAKWLPQLAQRTVCTWLCVSELDIYACASLDLFVSQKLRQAPMLLR
jgi:hypothetical protein